MGLPRSTYYAAPEGRPPDAEIVAEIRAITDDFECYGYRRVGAELRHRGHVVNAKKVRRLMREHDLNPRRRRRFGVQPTLSVWRPGEGPMPPKPWRGTGRPPSLMRRSPDHKPVSVKALAQELPREAWRTVCWHEATNADLSSRFAAVRLRPASRDYTLTQPRAEEWLLVEWPEGDAEPLKYWLSTLAADISLEHLVNAAKLRWRIERDYQELKQEIGLGHYEGRGWRGFHHHASLCIAAYGFLISQRETIPPSAPGKAQSRSKSAVPEGYRPRGSPDPTRASRRKLDPNHPKTPDHRAQSQPSALSMLLHQNNARTNHFCDAVRLERQQRSRSRLKALHHVQWNGEAWEHILLLDRRGAWILLTGLPRGDDLTRPEVDPVQERPYGIAVHLPGPTPVESRLVA